MRSMRRLTYRSLDRFNRESRRWACPRPGKRDALERSTRGPAARLSSSVVVFGYVLRRGRCASGRPPCEAGLWIQAGEGVAVM